MRKESKHFDCNTTQIIIVFFFFVLFRLSAPFSYINYPMSPKSFKFLLLYQIIMGGLSHLKIICFHFLYIWKEKKNGKNYVILLVFHSPLSVSTDRSFDVIK